MLLAFFEEAGEARLVFTKRPDTMPYHRGEIVFPGGKVDPALDPIPRDAALREAREEVGLDPALVDVVAELDHISTFAGAFTIVPFVGLVDTGRPALAAHPREVVRVFDVAVSELLDDATYREEHWETPGAARSMYFYELEDETVWGATARILTGLLAHLTGTADLLGRSW